MIDQIKRDLTHHMMNKVVLAAHDVASLADTKDDALRLYVYGLVALLHSTLNLVGEKNPDKRCEMAKSLCEIVLSEYRDGYKTFAKMTPEERAKLWP